MNAGKLWLFHKPIDTTFAVGGGGGRPYELVEPAQCSLCLGGSVYARPGPLSLEWDPGFDTVGDFTEVWAYVAVTKPTYEVLASHFKGIHAGPIEMIQDPKLKRPMKPNRRTKRRIWLPYTGPELVELVVERVVPYLPSSTWELTRTCKECGRESRDLVGVGEKGHRYNIALGDLVPFHQPRIPGKGFFVAASAVGDTPIFRFRENEGGIFCTDEVKNFIEGQGFTNIDFCEYGDIVDE